MKPTGDWGSIVRSKVDARCESWRAVSRRASAAALGV